jgi:hypothetical protein
VLLIGRNMELDRSDVNSMINLGNTNFICFRSNIALLSLFQDTWLVNKMRMFCFANSLPIEGET